MKKTTFFCAIAFTCVITLQKNTHAQLALHLTFDNANLNDFSGNAAHATNNGCTFAADRFGNPNSALIVDNGSWLQGPSTNFPLGNSSRSISVWVEMDSKNLAYAGVLLAYGGCSPSGNGYGMMLAKNCGGGYCGLKVYSFGFGSDYKIPYTASLNSWVHLVATYSGSSVKIYVNGVLQGTCPKSWNTTSGGGIYSIGNSKVYHPPYATCGFGMDEFKGKIDDIRLYKHVLSQQEISDLYNATSQVGITDLANEQISIYPNPANDFIKITGIKNIQTTSIFDITGKSVRKYNATEINDNTIVLENIEQGIYIISVTDESGNVYTKKFTHIVN